MLELTADNAVDYLRPRGWIAGPARIEALGGGVSNAVLRVETPERLFVLKQSRPQLRTRDAWFSDLDRVYREQEVMEMLAPLLPPHTVPEVLFVARATRGAGMETTTPGRRNRFGRGRTRWPHPRPHARDHRSRSSTHRTLPRSHRIRAAACRSVLSPHSGTPSRSRRCDRSDHRTADVGAGRVVSRRLQSEEHSHA